MLEPDSAAVRPHRLASWRIRYHRIGVGDLRQAL